ncbi:MAG: hypothetical protein K2Z81_13380, partial [Cyanobacteria bacterium]|nr:hypothetical protein [Cyanobacteriota bacterium]
NPEKFNEFVDVTGLVTSFTDEIIFSPADETPNLTKLQRMIGLGSLHSARTSIDNSLIFQVQNLVQYDCAHPETATSNDGTQPQSDVRTMEEVDNLDNTKDDAHPRQGIAHAISAQFKDQRKYLKARAYQKMLDYARSHPDTLVHRIFNAQEANSGGMKAIMQYYGFRKVNYRGVRIRRGPVDCLCTLRFYSPKIKDEVEITLELERPQHEILTTYRICKFVDLKTTFRNLGEETDDQIHGLVAYGQDINKEAVAQQARTFLHRVGKRLAGRSETDDEMAED